MKSILMILLAFNVVLWTFVIYITSKQHLLQQFFHSKPAANQSSEIITTQTLQSPSPTNLDVVIFLVIIAISVIPMLMLFFRKKQK